MVRKLASFRCEKISEEQNEKVYKNTRDESSKNADKT